MPDSYAKNISIANMRPLRTARLKYLRGACLALVLALAPCAGAAELTPQTRIRLTVVQWMPLTGQYERWEALGGELIVSADGEIAVPVVGAVSVVGKSPEQVANEVGELLRKKLGLVETPNTSIDVVEFPPVYVIGSVMAPGAFPYRPGMTVLQALALAGDRTRTEMADVSSERIRLVGELRAAEEGLLRARARIARLQAEFSGVETVEYPPDLIEARSALAKEVMAQEEAIFAARANSLSRQAAALDELSDLFEAEIENLKARVETTEQVIASTETELAGVISLVDRGVATVARRSELERTLAATRVDRLDQLTAILRAQQGLSEANRNALTLGDQRRTEVAQELQAAQALVEQLARQQQTAQRLLLQLDYDDPVAATLASESLQLTFTIVRQSGATTMELVAEETTALVPGDVLKVTAAPEFPAVAEAD